VNGMHDLNIPSEAELERFTMPPPQFIGLEVTMRCNLQCPMCHPHAHTPHSEFSGMDMKLDVVDLTAPLLRTAKEVWLSGGGEPLLLSYLPDFIDRCHEYNPNIDVNFISNGVLLSERNARMAIEKRAHLIEFSMDGTIQYGHVGGGADYDKVKENLRRLARLKEEYGVQEPHIAIDFVAMRDNLCELPGLIEFASEIDATINVQALSPASEEQRYQNVFRHLDYTLRVLDQYKAKAQQLNVSFDYRGMTEGLSQTLRNCEVPDRWLWVSYGGELCPCCASLKIGRNIYEEGLSVEDVWNGPFMRRLRWELHTGHHNATCTNCAMAANTIENQERSLPSAPPAEYILQLERQIAASKNRICLLEAHLQEIRNGKVMRLLRTMEQLVGKERIREHAK
jgi:MoaA/NifB/PqqE/SkfB family radical SAM enzyme